MPVLDRDNKYLVMAALDTLGALNAIEAMEKIILLAAHEDPDIRKKAAEVMGEIEG